MARHRKLQLPPENVFVVRRRVYDEYSHDDIPIPAEQYAAVFLDRTAAEDHARHLDRTHIRTNLPSYLPSGRTPFDDGLAEATRLPDPVFRDWLQDVGIEPPELPGPLVPERHRPDWMSDEQWAERVARESGPRWIEVRQQAEESARTELWKRWWLRAVVNGAITRDQLAHLWEGLDKVRFHEVVEVPAEVSPPGERVAFAVVHAHWEYDDCWYNGANDALVIYPTRAVAEAELARRRRALCADREFGNGGPNHLVVVELQLSPEG